MSHFRKVIRLLDDLTAENLPIEDRRRSLVDAVGKLVGSHAHYWAWGRGRPRDGPPTPLGIIPCGFTPERMAIFIEMAMLPEADRVFRLPLLPQLPRAVAARPGIMQLADWHASALFASHFRRMALDEWLIAVHEFGQDTWAQLFFAKSPGEPPFSGDDVELADAVLGEISWLHPDIVESVPPDTLAGLSARQKTVLPLLVDGHSRKRIAELMCVAESTVNDHVKAIYRHFGVHSGVQLAAKFMKKSGNRT